MLEGLESGKDYVRGGGFGKAAVEVPDADPKLAIKMKERTAYFSISVCTIDARNNNEFDNPSSTRRG